MLLHDDTFTTLPLAKPSLRRRSSAPGQLSDAFREFHIVDDSTPSSEADQDENVEVKQLEDLEHHSYDVGVEKETTLSSSISKHLRTMFWLQSSSPTPSGSIKPPFPPQPATNSLSGSSDTSSTFTTTPQFSFDHNNSIQSLSPPEIPRGRRQGKVRFFNAQLGYGFLVDLGPAPSVPTRIRKRESRLLTDEVFCHFSSIKFVNTTAGPSQMGPLCVEGNVSLFRSLRMGERVEFTVVQGDKKYASADVTGPNGGPVEGDPSQRGRIVVHNPRTNYSFISRPRNSNSRPATPPGQNLPTDVPHSTPNPPDYRDVVPTPPALTPPYYLVPSTVPSFGYYVPPSSPGLTPGYQPVYGLAQPSQQPTMMAWVPSAFPNQYITVYH